MTRKKVDGKQGKELVFVSLLDPNSRLEEMGHRLDFDTLAASGDKHAQTNYHKLSRLTALKLDLIDHMRHVVKRISESFAIVKSSAQCDLF